MFLQIFIICNIMLLGLTLLIDRDILNPNYLFLMGWTVAGITVFFTDFSYDADSVAFLYLALGSIVFCFGNLLGHGAINKDGVDDRRLSARMLPNYRLLALIQLVQLLAVAYSLIGFRGRLASSSGGNIVQSYLYSRDASGAGSRSGYLINVNSAVCIVLLLYYRWIPESERKRYIRYMLFEAVIYVVMLFLRFTRNSVLLYSSPLLFVYFFISNKDNGSRIKSIALCLFAFLIFFVAYSRLKYDYLYTDDNFITLSTRELSGYLSGGIVAFLKVFDISDFPATGGENTFRFFIAVFDRLRGTTTARKLVQQYTELGGSSITNVYTFYHWYICDFGLAYGLLMQFFIAFLHGRLYKLIFRGSLYGTYLYCLMTGPLLLQFFQDEYFSLSSNWLQTILVGVLFIWLQDLVWRIPMLGGQHSKQLCGSLDRQGITSD